MRSNGLATILLLIPILAIPALAIFGVPQITPLIDISFGEPRESDFDSRTGSNSKSSHEDLFGDVEGFGPEADFKDEPAAKRHDAIATEGKSGASAARRRRDSSESKWDDDLDDLNKRSEKSQRRPSNKDRAAATASDDEDQNLSESEKRLRQFKRQQLASTDTSMSQYSSASSDPKPAKLKFDAEDERHPQPSEENGKRSRSKKTADQGRGESHTEQLTLNSAIERLNELDIRSFRLEPGKEAGEFIFICSYTPENTPRVSYRFEAVAEEPLKAVEKVLAQISEWQQRQ